jgi:hypothetical protein
MGLGVGDWGIRDAMGGERGIRALKDSNAMKDLDFRRMCRFISSFGKTWEGILQKKMLKKYVRSRYVYEKK